MESHKKDILFGALFVATFAHAFLVGAYLSHRVAVVMVVHGASILATVVQSVLCCFTSPLPFLSLYVSSLAVSSTALSMAIFLELDDALYVWYLMGTLLYCCIWGGIAARVYVTLKRKVVEDQIEL